MVNVDGGREVWIDDRRATAICRLAKYIGEGREKMRLKCIKTCDMSWQAGGERVFTKGKEYPRIYKDNVFVFVLDDQFEEHEVGLPGNEFFDEFFEVTED